MRVAFSSRVGVGVGGDGRGRQAHWSAASLGDSTSPRGRDWRRGECDPSGPGGVRAPGVPDLAAAYTETRDRLVELVRPLDEPGVAAIVPATPAWTIKDVIAHLTHVAGAYATGHHSYQPKT